MESSVCPDWSNTKVDQVIRSTSTRCARGGEQKLNTSPPAVATPASVTSLFGAPSWHPLPTLMVKTHVRFARRNRGGTLHHDPLGGVTGECRCLGRGGGFKMVWSSSRQHIESADRWSRVPLSIICDYVSSLHFCVPIGSTLLDLEREGRGVLSNAQFGADGATKSGVFF